MSSNKFDPKVTTSSYAGSTSPDEIFKIHPESKREQVEKWFLTPLRKMNGHEGFILLMVLFPLYEKYLRVKHQMKAEAKFSKGTPALATIGRDLHLSEDDAEIFWQNFRNGLAHCALPKTRKDDNS